MTVLATIAGFLLYTALQHAPPVKLKFGSSIFAIAQRWMMVLVFVIFGAAIIVCSLAFLTGNNDGILYPFYMVGREMAQPWVNVSLIFFILGGWIAAYKEKIIRFVENKFDMISK